MTFPKNTKPTEAQIEAGSAAMHSHGDEGKWAAATNKDFYRGYATECLTAALSLPSQEAEAVPVDHVVSSDLSSCPFCGNHPRLVEPHQSDRSIEGETDDEEWLSFVECDCVDMFFVKGSASSQEEARAAVISAWNRRSPKFPSLTSQENDNAR